MISKDSYGRFFETLRISLIDTCNLACTYCKHDSNMSEYKVEVATLSYSDLLICIKKLHTIVNFTTIRLTGGEPTLYKNLVNLINDLKELNTKVKLTTNGYLLKNLIENIDAQNLHSINVSLDTLNVDMFYKISKRKGLQQIIEGIDAAVAKNIEVKLNCVITNNTNESEILPLMEFANQRKITIRFLELMNMGHLHNSKSIEQFSESDILKTISTKYVFSPLVRKNNSTANYWQTSEGQIFGIIANESSPFCHDCNRLRLDSYGNIFGCLSNSQGFNILDTISDDYALSKLLEQALAQKQPLKFKGSKMSMINIGG